MTQALRLGLLIGLICSFSGFGWPAAFADDPPPGGTVIERTTTTTVGPDGSVTHTETVEQKGMLGFQHSNKVALKYKERLKNYGEQIELGLTKGWLTADQAASFKKELARLSEIESQVSAKGYPKAETDILEKDFTKFNADLSAVATQGSSPKGATTKAPASAPPAATKTSVATDETKSVSASPAKKAPPRSPSKKASAKSKTGK
ncbi:MAG TPA: hypothetical protein V6D17_01765 [Candidatus Obscuribacterales bacterium]